MYNPKQKMIYGVRTAVWRERDEQYYWVSSAYRWWSIEDAFMSELSGVVYKIIGPKTELCGTPRVRGHDWDDAFDVLTEKEQEER